MATEACDVESVPTSDLEAVESQAVPGLSSPPSFRRFNSSAAAVDSLFRNLDCRIMMRLASFGI